MDIKRFFADGKPVDGYFELYGDELRHMTKVLRYKKGYTAIICNGDGNEYECIVTGITPDFARLKVESSTPCLGELDFSLTLYQAMPKNSKYDYIIQKCVELGVEKIVFFDSDFSCRGEWKEGRADKIALEACKQCGRARRVKVQTLPSFARVLDDSRGTTVIMPYEKALDGDMSYIANTSGALSLIIGSEGGFSEQEVQMAKNAGAKIVTLGKRILRCETAAAVATALAVYERGGLGK